MPAPHGTERQRSREHLSTLLALAGMGHALVNCPLMHRLDGLCSSPALDGEHQAAAVRVLNPLNISHKPFGQLCLQPST